jgi:hypothetical protein
MSRRGRSSLYDALTRAREALVRARTSTKTDPWRVAELQLRYDEALAAALDAGAVDAPAPRGGPPAPRRPEPAAPLARLDESVPPRVRRGVA